MLDCDVLESLYDLREEGVGDIEDHEPQNLAASLTQAHAPEYWAVS